MTPTLAPTPKTGNVLTDAYMMLKDSQDAPGKKEQILDKLGNIVASTSDSPTLTFLNNFYDANSSLISSAAAGLASLDNKTIDHAITGFSESVKVVMNGLDALGQVHPFIGVAVVAFKLVVTLDLARRENNQKVMVVKIQMQQMMCTLFQLRRVKDPDEVGPDGMILKDRFQPLMEQIAQDIKECGSACDVYLKKSFIAKTLKSKIYEGRLARYAAKFMSYRDDLDKALTVHIALGVDTANEKLDTQSSQLQSIEMKLDLLQRTFRKLDTPPEREVLDLIEQNGGPEAVIERDDLLQSLVKKSGETMENLADQSFNSKSDIDSVKKKLRRELAEDLDVVLKRNFSLFDRKLDIQYRNIEEALDKQKQYIVSALSSGSHNKIENIDIQNVWRDMGGKGSVKAHHFVLALRDYFTDQVTTRKQPPRGNDTSTIQAPSPEDTPGTQAHLDPVPSLPGLVNDEWALQYIDVAHLQSILEAIDDDGTGFVSIKEANTFAIERPEGWSLLHWIAFWAQGWEMSLADYKNKILLILQEMDRLRQAVLKENRYHVDGYFRHSSIAGIELVMRATKTATEYNLCPELVSLTEAHTSAEEERLRNDLENIRYDMDSSGTVTLITGPGRIERYLFPLLYLTLRRHLEVFHYACRNIVDSEEFSHMSTTLGSIFDVVEQRIESLGAIYKQVHVDINSRLENFALGMFHDISVNRYSYGSRESLITTWKDTSKTKNESDEITIIKDPENAKPIFSSPDSQINYQSGWLNWPGHSFDANPYSGTMLGSWTGHIWWTQGDDSTCALGLTELIVEVDPEDHSILKGNAVTYSGKLEVNGRRRRLRSEGKEYDQLDLIASFKDGFSLRLVGNLIEEDEELVGQWTSFSGKGDARLAYDTHPFGDVPPIEEAVQNDDTELVNDEDRGEGGDVAVGVDAKGDGVNDVRVEGEDVEPRADEDEPVLRTFIFRRTPVEVEGFRSLLCQDENKAKARWAFLRESVLYLIRRQLWSWSYLKVWNMERTKFLDFYKREWLLLSRNIKTPNPMTEAEKYEWYDMKCRLPPSIISLCVEALSWSLDRLPFHYAIQCDGCGYGLIDERFICLTCMDPEMSNSFDLCSECKDEPAERHDFTHTADHTLIKARQYIHQYSFAWLVIAARLMTTRLKKTFAKLQREEQDGYIAGAHHVSTGGHSELLCGCCAKPVRVPCWVCITCSQETYVCLNCEENEQLVLKDGPGSSTHCPNHHLLRLHNLMEAHFQRQKADPAVTRINELETTVNHRLEALESSVKSRVFALENRMGAQLALFESRMVALENRMGAQLTLFESLLRSIALQLKARDPEEAVDSDNCLNDIDHKP